MINSAILFVIAQFVNNGVCWNRICVSRYAVCLWWFDSRTMVEIWFHDLA